MTQMIETIRKEFLTVEDVSRYTSLPVRTIRKMAKSGLVDYYRPVPGETTRMYFKRSDIDAYMMNCRITASGAETEVDTSGTVAAGANGKEG